MFPFVMGIMIYFSATQQTVWNSLLEAILTQRALVTLMKHSGTASSMIQILGYLN